MITRGVFFDSKLFGALNGTWSDTSPLAGATINGNTNNGSAHLNARVIQMVITRNATLAQSWKILELAATNTTGNVTSFALPVTDEFYTLGLASEVDDLVPNAVVEDSGNHSAPPPSPTLWELFWNAIAGLANAVWNAVVAVAMFIVAVVTWLVNVAVGLVIGLVTGDWTYFQENVLDPLVEAINAFVQFLVELVALVIKALLSPLFDGLRSWQGRIVDHAGALIHESWEDFHRSSEAWQTKLAGASAIIFGPEFLVANIVMTAVLVAIAVLSFVMPLISIILLVALLVIFVVIAEEFSGGVIPHSVQGPPAEGSNPGDPRPEFSSHYPDTGLGFDMGSFLDWLFFGTGIVLESLTAIYIVYQVEIVKNPAFEPPAVALTMVLWVAGILILFANSWPQVQVQLFLLFVTAAIAASGAWLAALEMLIGKIPALKGAAFLAFPLNFAIFWKAYYDFQHVLEHPVP